MPRKKRTDTASVGRTSRHRRKKVPGIFELIGSGSKKASVEEMKRLLDEMRVEDIDL